MTKSSHLPWSHDPGPSRRALGWDAVHVSDLGLSRSSDEDLLNLARKESRCCITLDHAFHAHLARQSESGPSVILLRTEGLNAEAQAALIKRIFHLASAAIAEGAAVSAGIESLRIRKLPLRAPSPD